MKLTTQQIGKAGELLVQYQLLLHGIESSRLTTDTGIDLVAYSPRKEHAFTIQVKTVHQAKRNAGKGPLKIDWWPPQDSPAELFAFVHLATNRVWLVRTTELDKVAQQKPEGRYHFVMTTEADAKDRKDGQPSHDFEFVKYLLENRRVSKLF